MLRIKSLHPFWNGIVGNILQTASIGALTALTIRIGFWGPLYYHFNEEPPPKKIEENKQLLKPLCYWNQDVDRTVARASQDGEL